VRYTEYSRKFDYLFYWFNLCYDLERKKIETQIEEKEEGYRIAKERKKSTLAGIKEDIERLEKELAKIGDYERDSFKYLNTCLEEISDLFFLLYSYCIEIHADPTAIYERGRIFFDEGNFIGFLTDINALIAKGFTQAPEINFQIGQAYNEANQYDQAIKILSEVVQVDPEKKEAYFERALAYFETGQFDLALSDYILSDLHPTLIDPNNEHHFQYLKFSKGLTSGILKGGIDSTVDFVPSLLSTIYGIGKGLWVFSSDPVGVSKELVDGCNACIGFIRDNLSAELITELIPELRECIEKWDQLEEDKKGYYAGYVIGRYGVDMLAWGGSMRAVKLFRDMYKANSVLTLEKLSKSGANCEELILAAQRHFVEREAYKTKCWLHRGKQEKHIPGANNYLPDRDKLLVSMEKIEELAKNKLGDGIPQHYSFGEANYREVVNFGEIIGEHITKDGEKILTSVGEIHYNAEGAYHVSPVHPKKWFQNE